MADSEARGVGRVNSVGVPEFVGQRMGGEGGNNERGPIDNVLPTGNVARGNDISAKGGFDRGVRKDMSVTRNVSKRR